MIREQDLTNKFKKAFDYDGEVRIECNESVIEFRIKGLALRFKDDGRIIFHAYESEAYLEIENYKLLELQMMCFEKMQEIVLLDD